MTIFQILVLLLFALKIAYIAVKIRNLEFPFFTLINLAMFSLFFALIFGTAEPGTQVREGDAGNFASGFVYGCALATILWALIMVPRAIFLLYEKLYSKLISRKR